MTETQNRITACLNSALQSFNQNEQYLISRDLSERCICAKFASYLERAIAESEFCEYVVDVEYNRGSCGNEHAAKVLNGHKIVVDLIVHKRGYDEQRGFNNLFCIITLRPNKPDGFDTRPSGFFSMEISASM